MIDHLPTYVSVLFELTTATTLGSFIWAIRQSNAVQVRKQYLFILFGLMVWLVIQAVLTLNNIYTVETDSFPPKIMLLVILPPVFTILLLFLTAKGRLFIDSLPLTNLTYLNAVRILVEIVLFFLYLNRAIPELMTFEGRNFDILAGLTAPLIAYFGFTKHKISKNVILIWNFISLALLINIVVNALFSVPSPIQKFAFEQPNIAILNFPFSWLPTFIVPVVLFGHLTSIRQLLKWKTL